MKQGEAYSEAFFDLAIQNMLKRTIARGIADEASGVTKVSVLADVKPITPPVIKTNVTAVVRSLEEETNIPYLSENHQPLQTENEIDYLVKLYNRVSSLDSRPYVPSVPKRDKGDSEQSDSVPNEDDNKKEDKKPSEKPFYQEVFEGIKDFSDTFTKLGEVLSKIKLEGFQGVKFSDLSELFGKSSKSFGLFLDDLFKGLSNSKILKGIDKYEKAKEIYKDINDIIDGDEDRKEDVAGYSAKYISRLLRYYPFAYDVKTRFAVALAILDAFFGEELDKAVENVARNQAGKDWDDDANNAGSTPNVDPLVLDLSGDGFKPTTLDKGVHFDLDGNGFAERINWIQGDDALLVLDKNGDGTVNDGNELFGDRYRLANGQLAKFGFEALLEQDSNGDKVIDEKDENFSRLQVWQDANQNGISEKEELRSLSQAEIAAIQLNYDKSKLASQEEVTFGNSAKFIKANGETGDATEYWVKKRGYDTKMLKDVDIPLDVMFLPNVAGSGNLPSLHQAMAMDETGQLKDKVGQFILSRDAVERRQLVESILLQMAGAESTASNSRGSAMDAKQLHVIEAMLGREYTGTSGANPHAGAAPILKTLYQKMVDHYYYTMMTRSHLSGVAPLIQVKEDKTIDFTLLNAVLPEYLTVEAGIQLSDVAGYLKHMEKQGISGYETFKAHFGAMSYENLKAIMIGGQEAGVGTDKDETLQANEKQPILIAQKGNDRVLGDKANNILDGGKDNDYLAGGDGDDTYVFEVGHGVDRIEDNRGLHRIKFGEGIGLSDLKASISPYSGLILENTKTGERLVLESFRYSEGYRNFVLEFSDGTEVAKDADNSPFKVLNGTSSNETLNAIFQGSTLNGHEGDDSLNGSSTADVLNGGAGKDNLQANGGNDILNGEKGNDYLNGGAGDDTYVFELGHGEDTISDSQGQTTIQFKEGITASDVTLAKSNSYDLEVAHHSDKILLSNYRYSSSYQNVTFAFSDQKTATIDTTTWSLKVNEPVLPTVKEEEAVASTSETTSSGVSTKGTETPVSTATQVQQLATIMGQPSQAADLSATGTASTTNSLSSADQQALKQAQQLTQGLSSYSPATAVSTNPELAQPNTTLFTEQFSGQ